MTPRATYFANSLRGVLPFTKTTIDLVSREKQRVPSWTDRVLWLSLKRGEISASSYESHPDCSISDHKPVSAVLRIPVSMFPILKTNLLRLANISLARAGLRR